MIISGDTNRRMLASRDYSYLLDFSLDNSTGSAFFGFSGASQTFGFTFDRGRILDPSNKYVYSYRPNENISISGNVNSGAYDYKINNDLISQSSVPAFFAEKFYFNVTGCALDFDLHVNTISAPPLAFTFPTGFVANENLSLALSSVGNTRSFTIFSGELLLGGSAAQNFYIQDSFPISLQTGTSLTLSSSGTSQGTSYPINLVLYTSFGTVKTGFSTTGQLDSYITNWQAYNYNNSGSGAALTLDENAANLTSSLSGVDAYGNWGLFYAVSDTGVAKTLRLNLTYFGGETGTYSGGYVTGSSVTYGGVGYSTVPLLSFDGGGGVGATGLAFTGSSSTVTGIQITNIGSGYTSVPDISFIGGSPSETASGVALLSGYNKNFTGSWDLLTGTTSSSVVSFAQNNYVSTAITGFTRTISLPDATTHILVMVKNHHYYDPYIQSGKLEISGLSATSNYYSVIITGGFIS